MQKVWDSDLWTTVAGLACQVPHVSSWKRDSLRLLTFQHIHRTNDLHCFEYCNCVFLCLLFLTVYWQRGAREEIRQSLVIRYPATMERLSTFPLRPINPGSHQQTSPSNASEEKDLLISESCDISSCIHYFHSKGSGIR